MGVGGVGRFSLVTRASCHLCEQMAAVLDDYGLSYDTIDADRDIEMGRLWGDTVPVLLRDGTAVAKVRLDRRQLRRIVRRRR